MTLAGPRFELDPRLSPAGAVRRAALAQLDHGLAALARGDARGVHEARKACKKVRALLRLVRPSLGAAYRVENRRLRDASRAISPLREAGVLPATARSLGLALTAGAGAHRAGKDPAAIRRAVTLLQGERRAIADWPPETLSREALGDELVEGYRRARRSGQRVRRHPRAAVLHEWRKQVKYHRYQCEAVAPLWPRLARRVRALDALGNALGRHHDVEVLAEELRRRPHRLGDSSVVLRAARRMRREQERIAAKALRAGRKLFDGRAHDWFDDAVSR